MMSGPSAPSPMGGPQRANSTGPNGPLPSPGGPLANGITGNAGPSNAGGGGPGPGQPPMSQQNLNQIVSDAFVLSHSQPLCFGSGFDGKREEYGNRRKSRFAWRRMIAAGFRNNRHRRTSPFPFARIQV